MIIVVKTETDEFTYDILYGSSDTNLLFCSMTDKSNDMATMTEDCGICVTRYNKTINKKITCPSCEESACATCVKRFLLENTIEPKCMNCNARWNMEFIRDQLSKGFLEGEYRKKQVSNLVSEAETRIEQYQSVLRREVRKEQVRNELKYIKAQINALKFRLHQKEREYWRVEGGRIDGEEASERQQFFMACPRTDCRGRVSSAYKCGLCDHWVCPDCHADKGVDRHAEHTCAEDDKKTVAMLRENTRPCPKCHTGIFKVSGCDQMWCVSCHTCFSWNSGRILTGNVHNPHYYEFMRRVNGGEAPRNALDLPCGGVPNAREMYRAVRDIPSDMRDKLNRYHRMMVHVSDVTLARVQGRVNTNDTPLGVKYLRGQSSREDWGRSLYLLKRKEERERRYLDIVQMMVGNAGDIFRNFVAKSTDAKMTADLLDRLVDYANENIDVINRQYTVNRPHFDYRLEEFPF